MAINNLYTTKNLYSRENRTKIKTTISIIPRALERIRIVGMRGKKEKYVRREDFRFCPDIGETLENFFPFIVVPDRICIGTIARLYFNRMKRNTAPSDQPAKGQRKGFNLSLKFSGKDAARLEFSIHRELVAFMEITNQS